MSTDLQERTEGIVEGDIVTSTDKPESAHYVMCPNDEETNHAYVMRARLEGFSVTALCGYTWVPHKMATGLPVCQECREIWESLPDTGGGDPRE